MRWERENGESMKKEKVNRRERRGRRWDRRGVRTRVGGRYRAMYPMNNPCRGTYRTLAFVYIRNHNLSGEWWHCARPFGARLVLTSRRTMWIYGSCRGVRAAITRSRWVRDVHQRDRPRSTWGETLETKPSSSWLVMVSWIDESWWFDKPRCICYSDEIKSRYKIKSVSTINSIAWQINPYDDKYLYKIRSRFLK